MCRDVTPQEALQGRSWTIVNKHGVYDLYRNEGEARSICNDLNRYYGEGTHEVARVRHGTCKMVDLFEREDEDGTVWPDAYRCTSCDTMVLGYLPEPGVMNAPHFCPMCGARVEEIVPE